MSLRLHRVLLSFKITCVRTQSAPYSTLVTKQRRFIRSPQVLHEALISQIGSRTVASRHQRSTPSLPNLSRASMEDSEKKNESWAEHTIRQTPVDVSEASKQAAEIEDGVDCLDARAKVDNDASSVKESVEDACLPAEDTPNPPDGPSNHNGLIITVAGVALGVAATPLVMPAALGALGFSAIGPVAGSVAAALQSAGWAGGVFSAFQSAAMGGYGVGAVTGAFAAAGGVAGGAAGAAAGAAAAKAK